MTSMISKYALPVTNFCSKLTPFIKILSNLVETNGQTEHDATSSTSDIARGAFKGMENATIHGINQATNISHRTLVSIELLAKTRARSIKVLTYSVAGILGCGAVAILLKGQSEYCNQSNPDSLCTTTNICGTVLVTAGAVYCLAKRMGLTINSQSSPAIPGLAPQSSPPVFSEIKELKDHYSDQEFDKAADKLLYLCDQIEGLPDLQKKDHIELLYNHLFNLFPHIATQSMDPIQNLLDCSPEFKDMQKKLTETLGRRHKDLASQQAKEKDPNPLLISTCQTAIGYFAKAISIDPVSSHHEMNEIVIIAICYCLKNRLGLAVGSNGEEEFQRVLDDIKHLQPFCSDQKDYKLIYKQVETVLRYLPEKYKKKYSRFSAMIAKAKNIPFPLSQKPVTQFYRSELERIREAFKKPGEDFRGFQMKVARNFTNFFYILLRDAFAIMGPAPCAYDIRAMGSVGREELCPFSDLEYMILIKDDKFKYYFKGLAQILELQINSLGETALDLTLTCLRKTHTGFHVDLGGNPGKGDKDFDLIRTPQKMAQLQKNGHTNPQTHRCTTLKSISLAHSSDELFNTYQNEVISILNQQERKTFVTALLKQRLDDFNARYGKFSSSDQNVKELYVELINHALKDLSIYFEIHKTNTLDIIEALVEKKVLTPNTGELLKEVVASLHQIRLRLHLHYGEQNEKGMLPGPNNPLQSDFCRLTHEEAQSLGVARIFVLQPLYHLIGQMLQEEKSIQEAFQLVHLPAIAFESRITHPQNDRSSIKRFISCLVTTFPKEDAEHNEYYKKLSQLQGTEELCTHYIETLQIAGNSLLAESLSLHPICLGQMPSMEEIEKQQLYRPNKAHRELYSTLPYQASHYASITNIQGEKSIQGDFQHLVNSGGPDSKRQNQVLKAIELFIGLEKIKPTSVTIKYCSILESKSLASFLHSDLEYLDLRYCTLIKNADIRMIAERCPKLKQLYLSGCSRITYLSTGFLRGHTPLVFRQLEILELNHCENLTDIQLVAPLLKSAQICKNLNLKVANLQDVPLGKIDYQGSPKCIRSLVEYFCKSHPTLLDEEKEFILYSLNNPNFQNTKKRNCLIWATEKKHAVIVRFLLENGININLQEDIDGQSALIIAASSNDIEIVKLILAKNANLNLQTKDGSTALILAADKGHKEIVELLLSKKAKIDVQEKDGWTSLMLAAHKGHKEIVTLLISKGANFDRKAKYGWTSLMLAVDKGHKEIAETLLSEGANLDLQMTNGATALILAAGKGLKEIVGLLLSKGANFDLQMTNGTTALMLATDKGHKEIVKLLLPNGAKIDLQMKDGRTALILAANKGHKEIVEFLISKGAKIDLQMRAGHLAFSRAARDGDMEIAELLLSKGVAIGLPDEYYDTSYPLFAAAKNFKEIARGLRSKGTAIDLADENDTASLMLATAKGLETLRLALK